MQVTQKFRVLKRISIYATIPDIGLSQAARIFELNQNQKHHDNQTSSSTIL